MPVECVRRIGMGRDLVLLVEAAPGIGTLGESVVAAAPPVDPPPLPPRPPLAPAPPLRLLEEPGAWCFEDFPRRLSIVCVAPLTE